MTYINNEQVRQQWLIENAQAETKKIFDYYQAIKSLSYAELAEFVNREADEEENRVNAPILEAWTNNPNISLKNVLRIDRRDILVRVKLQYRERMIEIESTIVTGFTLDNFKQYHDLALSHEYKKPLSEVDQAKKTAAKKTIGKWVAMAFGILLLDSVWKNTNGFFSTLVWVAVIAAGMFITWAILSPDPVDN